MIYSNFSTFSKYIINSRNKGIVFCKSREMLLVFVEFASRYTSIYLRGHVKLKKTKIRENFVTNKSKLPQDGAQVFPYMG